MGFFCFVFLCVVFFAVFIFLTTCSVDSFVDYNGGGLVLLLCVVPLACSVDTFSHAMGKPT